MKNKIYRWDEILNRIKDIKNPVVAEIGVDNGKTSKRLLKNHPSVILHMVDWWKAPDKNNSYASSGASIPGKGKEYFERTYQNCRAIYNQYKKRCFIHRGDSLKIVDKFNDNYFDLVFIDADHSYEGCIKDIKAWYPKVKLGGIICGHDYDHPDQGEVKKAVDEYFENIELGENRTWFVRKTDGHIL